MKRVDSLKAGEECEKVAKLFQVPISLAPSVIKKYQLTGTVEV